MRCKLLATILLSFLFVNNANAFTVDSVSVTESRCKETGSIMVHVTDNGACTGTIYYQITAGPKTTPATTSNSLFTTLPSSYTNYQTGASINQPYTVVITQGTCSQTIQVYVPGTYVEPGLQQATVQNIHCPGSTGCIYAKQPTNGNTPFTYQLVAGPVTTAIQSDTNFCNLPKGTYSLQSVDSCGVIRTSSFSIGYDTSSFAFSTTSVLYYNCNDVVFINNNTYLYGGGYYKKLKIWYITPSGDTLLGYKNTPGVWKVLAMDECGRIKSDTFRVVGQSLYSGAVYFCDGVGIQLRRPYSGISGTAFVYRCSDSVLIGQYISLASNGSYQLLPDTFDYGQCYFIKYITNCNDTLYYKPGVTGVINDLTISMTSSAFPVCTAGPNKGAINFYQSASGTPPFIYKIIAGPQGVGDSAISPHGTHTMYGYVSGTYTTTVTDACGRKDTSSATVVGYNKSIAITQTPNCSGGANVHVVFSTNHSAGCCVTVTPGVTVLNQPATQSIPVNVTIVPKIVTNTTTNNYASWTGDFVNILTDSLKIHYTDNSGGSACTYDTTIAVNKYVAPFLTNVTGAVCATNNTGKIYFTLNGGVKPFKFQIRPYGTTTWSPLQNSTIFTGLTSSVYEVNVVDVCPNGSVTQFTFYPWEASPIVVSNSCPNLGDSITFSAQFPDTVTAYSWLKDGVALGVTTPTLGISSYSLANNGVYALVQEYVEGTTNACFDTTFFNFIGKANAGANLYICKNDSVTVSASGITGVWTAVAGNPSGTIIVDSANSSTKIKGFSSIGTYNFIWTESAGCYDTIAVIVNNVSAGADQIVCDTSYAATMSASGTGTWSLGAGSAGTANIVNATDSNTLVTNFSAVGTYYMIWNNGSCADTTIITVLTLKRTSHDTTICFGESISICGNLHNATGTYVDTCVAANGCDSIVTTSLTVQPQITTTVNATSCNPADTGTVVTTLTAANGCDSIVTTITTLRPYSSTSQNVSVCFGGSVTVCGNVHNATGTYVDTCVAANGCDSIVTTNLIVRPQITTTVNATSCNPADTGTVVTTLTASYGCDSIVTTITTLRPSTTSSQTLSVCFGGSVTVCGNVHNATGTYVDTCVAANGCDSIVTTNLTVQPQITTTVNATSCNPADTGTVVTTLTAANGCDSIVTTITTLRPYSSTSQNVSVCFGGSVTVCGNVHNATGTYVDTCVAANGCDSIVTTNLTVRPQITTTVNATSCNPADTGTVVTTLTAANGCDSIVTTITTLRPSTTSSQTLSVCFGGSVTVCGNVHNATGTYVDTCVAANGCDSIVTTNLTVQPQITTTVNATSCNPADTGTVVTTLTAANGCDSIVTTITTLRPYSSTSQNVSVCFGGSVTVCGNVHNATGTYVDTCVAANGCDSIVTTNLTVRSQITTTVNATSCNPSDTGTVVTTLTAANGCDSVVTTITTLRPSTTSSQTLSVCFGGSVTVCGNVHNATGTYVDTCVAANGCDSIVTTNLTVRPQITSILDTTVCFGGNVTVCGNVHNATGTYVDTCVAANGCDSIVTTNLLVIQEITSRIDTIVCFGASVNVCGSIFDSTGVYTIKCISLTGTGCDSIITLYLTVQPQITVSQIFTICNGGITVCGNLHSNIGTYVDTCTAANGCDSIITTILIPCSDTIRDTNQITTTKVVCMPLEPGFVATSGVIGDCGYTNHSGNVYSVDANGCVTIERSNVVGYNLDTLCVVVCNAEGVCDTTTLIVSNTPKRDTVIDSICVGCTVDTCIAVEIGMNADTAYITSCSGTPDNTTSTVTTTVGCVKVTTTGVSIGVDTICVVVCDTIKDICDTTVIITHVLPKVDTIRDTNQITTTKVVCMPLEPGFVATSGVIGDCGYTNHSGNVYIVDANGCVTIERSNVVGYNLDTLCVVVCNAAGVCDTTTLIVSNTPKRDTVIDSVCVGCTVDTCIAVEIGMNADTAYITSCSGTPDNTTSTVTTTVGCVKVTTTGVSIGVDTICVVVCDTIKDICDTTVIITHVLPKVDTIRDTNQITTTKVVCMPLEPGFVATSGVIGDCGYTNHSGNVYSVDANGCVTIERSNVVGYNLDTLCVVVCNAEGVCDTTTLIVSNTPKRDTVIDSICVGCTVDTCIAVEPGMNADTAYITSCSGTPDNTTSTVTTTVGCVKVTTTGVSIGVDTICVVVCDTIKDICDTTVIITHVLPKVDTIRDTNQITTTKVVCMPLEPGFVATSGVIGDCGYTNHSGNVYIVDANGCVTIERSNVVGYNLDTLCVVVCNAAGVCDTTTLIVSNTPKRDTVIDSVCVGCTVDTCIAVEIGMNADTAYITSCSGTPDNTTSTVTTTVGCVKVTTTGVSIGVDTICVVVCDTIKDICDTTVIITHVLPKVDTIRDTNQITTTKVVCMPLEPGFVATSGVIGDCGYTNHSGNVYSVDANGCVTIERSNVVGYNLDTLCVVVCNAEGVCDTTTLIVSNTPKRDTVIDSICVGCTVDTCIAVEIGMNADTAYITSCSGTPDNTTSTVTTTVGCVKVTTTGVSIGVDTICVVVCDTIKDICDTTVIITHVLPKVDTIRDTNQITTTKVVCMPLEPGFVATSGVIGDCGYTNHSGNVYSVDANGCVTIERSNVVGYNLDTLCVVVCNAEGVCDTTTLIVSNTPKRDTVIDSVCVGCTVDTCIAVETGMNADTAYITSCSGTPDNTTSTVTTTVGCVKVTTTGVSIGVDTICVVVCDTIKDICDTTVIITHVLPKVDTIRDTNQITTTKVVCMPLEPGFVATSGVIGDCGYTNHSGNVYSVDANGCVTIERSNVVGYNLDTLCVVVCNAEGVCDTTTLIVSNTPKRDTVIDSICVGCTVDTCIAVEIGMNADTAYITSCSGTPDNTTSTVTTTVGCVKVTTTGVSIGVDTICVVVCDTIKDICDTTVIITHVLPKVDTIRDTNQITTTKVVCMPLEPGFVATSGVIGDCGYTNHSGNVYIVDANGCVTIERSNVVGYNLDTLCVVVCNAAGVCDTTTLIVSNTPKRDTVIDSVCVGCTVDTCIAVEIGMNADTAYITSCSGTPDNTTSTVTTTVGCVKVTTTGVSIGVDTICVVVCDTIKDICDTTVIITHVLPKVDTIRDTNQITTTKVVCMPLEPGFVATSGVIGDCGYTNHSGNVYSVDANGCVTIERSNVVGYNLDTLCVVVCNAEGVCDTTTLIVSNTPKRDTVIDSICVGCTVDTCIAVEPGMNADTAYITSCSGTPDNTTSTVTTTVGCVKVTTTGVSIGVDTICVVVCDTIKDICDTTVIITHVLPKVDTIRDTNQITTTKVVCMPLEPGFVATSGVIGDCGYTNHSGNVYIVDANGCVTIERSNVVGYNLDTLCVVVCNAAGVCDTTTLIVSNTPKRDTVIDSVCVGCTVDTCIAVEIGMNADTAYITSCSGTPDNTTSTVTTTVGCVKVTTTGVSIGVDTICVVVCDTIKDICDTTVIITHVLPKVDTIRDTNQITTTKVVCMPLEPGFVATSGVIGDCGYTNHSGNVYSVDANGCVTIERSNVVGYNLDTLCVVVCNAEGVCDTTTLIVSNTPKRDTVIDSICVGCTVDTCIAVEIGMNADTAYITSCSGTPDNTTSTVTTTVGCVKVTTTGVSIGVDTICVVVCDTIKDICDTTVIITHVLPKVDTIRDTNQITTTKVVCMPLEPGFVATSGVIGDCGYTNHSGNVYSVDANGCVTIERSNVVGYNLDTLCVVVCNAEGVCDTTTLIVSNTPKRDTVIDSVCVGCTVDTCIAVETGMNADTAYITSCSGTPDNTTSTVTTTVGCVKVTTTGVSIGVDTICVVVCDTIKDICDTTVIITHVLPKVDTIRDTNQITTTKVVCMPLEPGFVATSGVIGDCGYTNHSGNVYSVDANGCVTIERSNVVGYNLDTLCVVVCNAEGVCDTTTLIVSNIPKRDTIIDTLQTNDSLLVICFDTICRDTLNKPMIKLFRVIDGSVIGITSNWYIDSTTNCIYYQAGDTVRTDTILVVSCDTTVVIVHVLPRIDTIRDTNRVETTTVVCVPVEPGMVSGSIEVGFCGHSNNSGNVYTAGPGSNCITVVRSTTVGYNLDTLCIIVTDTVTGIRDTTIGIFSNLPGCPDLIRDTAIACTSTQGGGLCIPLTLQEIRKYNIYIDGTRSAQQFSSNSGCGVSLVDAGFNFSVVDYVDNVPHLLEGLDLDGTSPLSPMVNFNTLTELASYMNSIDTAGAWYVEGFNIKTANPNTRYRNGDGIAFFSEDPEAATYTVRYNDKTTYTSSLVSVPTGCHKVVLVDTITGCVDSATICVLGNCGPRDTVRTTVPVDSTVKHCYLTPTDSNTVVTSCSGSTTGTTSLGSWSIDTAGCLNYTAGPVVGIDTLCIVKCNVLVNKCDTVITIITITPRIDVIRDTNKVGTTATVCMPLDNGFGTPSSVSIINCGHTNNSGNVYSTSDSSCISVVRSTTVGYNLDTLCVVVCNTAGICDTTQVIVSNVPGTDTLPVRDSIVICIKTEPRDSNVIIKACDGTTSTVTVLGSYTIDSATQCIKYTAGNIIGSDTLCVVKCDTATGKCDTFHPVVVITPRIDTIRDTNTVGTTATVCMPLEGGFGTPSNVSIINCGHANNSGNVYSISGTSCITIVRSETVGYNLDTLCVVVCNARGICDTTTVIVSNEPKADTTKDTIRTTQPIRTNDTICNFVPSDTTGVIVTSCDGGVFGTTIYNGTWTIDSNKCLVYTAGSIKLNDTICIQVCKGDTCKQTIVIITVTGLPPVAVDDSVVTEVNTPVRIPVLPNDTTYDEDPLMLCGDGAIVTDPVHGSVIVNADGTVTYTPVTGYVGVDSFQYQICDPEGRDTAWVYIRIIGVCEIPNAITPNGDGINDVFVIPCATGDIEFSVWNRWGIEVYRSDKYLNDWDGRYKGSPLPDGTYYYVVKYRTTNGDEINKAGFITIHR